MGAVTSETCRVALQQINICILLHVVGFLLTLNYDARNQVLKYIYIYVSNLWVRFHEILLYVVYFFILLSSSFFVPFNSIEFAAQSNVTTVYPLKATINLNCF